jgi:ABC-type transport system substrate-binding protein
LVVDDATWDPHKTQAGPVYGQQALVFSRLLTYSDQRAATIVPDLAEDMPEQPDERTLIFRIKPGAKWHDRFPTNGRAVTSDDVKFSIERQRDGDPSFVHKASWQNIEAVEALEPHLIRVFLKTPMATAIPSFAAVNAFIVAPETSPDGQPINEDLQSGSGPFRWVEWQSGQFASVSRNPAWFGGSDRPQLDGLDLIQPANADEMIGKLQVKSLDAAIVGRPAATKLQQTLQGQLVEQTMGTSTFFGMRFFTPQAPYNDPRFRKAVSFALDRQAMINQFFAGSGKASSWVSWPMSHWTLPESALTTYAGHRPGEAGRAQDIAEANTLLAALGSAVPSDNPLFVIDEAEAAVGIGSLMREQLRSTIGLVVTVYPIAISEFVSRLFSGEAPWAAGPDTGSVDLDDWVYPYFHSAGVKNTMAVRNPDMDALIASQRTLFDVEQRQAAGYEIQRQLLEQAAAVNFVSEELVALTWPYVKDFPLDATDGYQDRFANTSIDTEHPSIRGRT